MFSIETILLIGAVLLLVSVLSSKLLYRFGIPALLLFLVIGMLAGSEGPGGIYFDDPVAAQAIGVVALAFILFSGGLDTDWQQVRPVLVEGALLATVGVALSTVVLGLFATMVLGLSLLQGLLLAAMVSSTDAAAVFSVLRARGVNISDRLRSTAEFESGSNDPMAVLLTTAFIQLLTQPQTTIGSMIVTFVLQFALGALFGYAFGKAIVWLINRLGLDTEGLYPVLTIAAVMLIYSGTSLVGGNGFLAVYIAGLVMGNSTLVHKGTLLRFHDGLAWLMQITMFLVLGLLVFPSQLLPIVGVALLIAAFLMFVARPVSVLVTLLPIRMPFREKLMLSWIGLRGAVPIILATFPLVSDLPGANLYFNVIFFVVFTSVLLQAPLIPMVAKWLGVEVPGDQIPYYPSRVFLPEVSTESRVVELEVLPQSSLPGKSIVDLKLPEGALIVLVRRGRRNIVPSGATKLEVGDEVLLLAEPGCLDDIRARFGALVSAGEENAEAT